MMWCVGSMQDATLGDIIPDSPGADEEEAASADLTEGSLGTALLASDMESIIYKVRCNAMHCDLLRCSQVSQHEEQGTVQCNAL